MKFLGHESPYMTAVYAEIHDKTLQQVIQKARGEHVDIYGNLYKAAQIVKSVDPELDDETLLDAKWLKRHIATQTLPNGICALPIAQSCPHANACLECPSFRTDKTHLPQLNEQLKRTDELIAQAR